MRARFILSQIAAGLRANLAMAISVVLVTFVSLTFVGAGILLQMQIGKLKDDWYDKVEISVFMCPSDSLQASCAGGEATQAQLDERSEEHTSELQSRGHLVCRLLLEKKKKDTREQDQPLDTQ